MGNKLIYGRIVTGQMSRCQLVDTFLTPADYREISQKDRDFILKEYGDTNLVRFLSKDSTPEKPIIITEQRFHFISVDDSELEKENPVYNGIPLKRVYAKVEAKTAPVSAEDIEIIKEKQTADNSMNVLSSMPDETGAVKAGREAITENKETYSEFTPVAESGAVSDSGKRKQRVNRR